MLVDFCMAEVYFKKDAFDEAIIPDAAFEQSESEPSEEN